MNGVHRSTVFVELDNELDRQDERWGEQNHDPPTFLAIIGEEYGEACQAMLHAKFPSSTDDKPRSESHYRTELLQTAACCVQAVMALDRRRGDVP